MNLVYREKCQIWCEKTKNENFENIFFAGLIFAIASHLNIFAGLLFAIASYLNIFAGTIFCDFFQNRKN